MLDLLKQVKEELLKEENELKEILEIRSRVSNLRSAILNTETDKQGYVCLADNHEEERWERSIVYTTDKSKSLSADDVAIDEYKSPQIVSVANFSSEEEKTPEGRIAKYVREKSEKQNVSKTIDNSLSKLNLVPLVVESAARSHQPYKAGQVDSIEFVFKGRKQGINRSAENFTHKFLFSPSILNGKTIYAKISKDNRIDWIAIPQKYLAENFPVMPVKKSGIVNLDLLFKKNNNTNNLPTKVSFPNIIKYPTEIINNFINKTLTWKVSSGDENIIAEAMISYYFQNKGIKLNWLTAKNKYDKFDFRSSAGQTLDLKTVQYNRYRLLIDEEKADDDNLADILLLSVLRVHQGNYVLTFTGWISKAEFKWRARYETSFGKSKKSIFMLDNEHLKPMETLFIG